MGLKLRTMVMKRKALCDLVVGATKIQGPGVGDSLGKYLSPVLGEEEALPDLAASLELYGRKLESYGDAMVAADEGYLAELAKLNEVRAEGEAPTRSLKDKILSLRSTCQGLFGEETLAPLALDFNLAQNLRGVLRQAEIIRERIKSSDKEMVSERWVNGTLDRESSARELDPEIEQLRLVVEQLVEQGKEVDTAKVRKDEALEEFDRQYILIARAVEATFRVAGETDLADRIRPTVRQLGRDDGKGQEEATPEASSQPEPVPESSAAPEPDSGTAGDESADSAA